METYNGRDFFDDDEVFKRYLTHRARQESPNQLIEKPAILNLLPSPLCGNILDLGCGYGDLADLLLNNGATSYTGIDSSAKMIALAKSQVKDERVEFLQADITQWAYPTAHYNSVISRLTLHYIADLRQLLAEIHESLKEDGELICSVEHPVLTSSMDVCKPEGKKGAWQVDQYFNLGSRVQDWLGGRVIKYHRTVEEYWRLFTQAGFRIEALQEGCPQPALFTTEDEFERRQRVPLFLVIKATKVY